MLYDGERKFLCLGRTRPNSTERHTIRPIAGDLFDPMMRLREQYDWLNFTVKDVYRVMVVTRHLPRLPLAAYTYDPSLVAMTRQERRAKRKGKQDAGLPHERVTKHPRNDSQVR
eukprot:COSAG06_NODE_3281_length_5562_cov_5.218927_2_plen_114_part_00